MSSVVDLEMQEYQLLNLSHSAYWAEVQLKPVQLKPLNKVNMEQHYYANPY